MALNPAALYVTPVLTNQHIAATFCLRAVGLLFVRLLACGWYNTFWGGAAWATSNLLRPELVVLVLAMACYVPISSPVPNGAAARNKSVATGSSIYRSGGWMDSRHGGAKPLLPFVK